MISLKEAFIASAVAGMLFVLNCGGHFSTSGDGDGSDTTPPEVESVIPLDGSTDTYVTSSVSIIFNEGMDEITAENAFALDDGVIAVSGSFDSWSGNTMTFSPDANLVYGTTYFITLDAIAKDLAGNFLQAAFSAQFTTESANTPYAADFTTIPDGTPSDYGFTTNNGEDVDDHFAITVEGYIDTSPSPGGWISAAFSPDMGIKDRNENGGVVINWKTMYPSEDNGSFRENNKLYVSLADENDNILYNFMYRPLTSPSESADDMELKVDGNLIAHIKTGNLVPYGASAAWVLFKMELTSTSIRVYMDHDGNGYEKYIDVDDATYSTFRKLHFQYKTDTDPLKNYYMYIADIIVGPIP